MMMRFVVFTVISILPILQQKVGADCVCADGATPSRAAKSCFDIYNCNPRSPSGLYYVNVKNHHGKNGPIRVYCDMQTRRCGVKGGWMLVTSLDMKNSAHKCPSHFKQEVCSGKRFCVKKVRTGCSSQTYSIGGVPYAEVCGKAIGYAYGSPDAAPIPVGTYRSIEAAYMQMGWFDWTISMVTLPFRFIYSFSYDLFNFLLAIVLGARPPPVSPDPTGDVHHFAARFTSTFGEQGPPLPQVGYSRIAEQAKEEIRFLLVYLHNWELPESEEYCRNVICSEEFVQVIRERNLLFWAVDVQSAEGKRVQYIVNGGNYPYVVVAMLKESRMTLIGRFEGSISKDAFMSALNSILDRSEPELVVTRHEKQERQVAQILRQQQDDAYLQSLKADKEKEEKRKAEMELELRKETYAKEKNKEWETECEYRISQLPPEPDPTSENLIHVVVRSTAGERLERNFLTTDKLHVLYDFALKCKDIPRCYVLATNYPKKILRLDDTGGPLLADLDLGKKCIVFVQDMTEDDEDE